MKNIYSDQGNEFTKLNSTPSYTTKNKLSKLYKARNQVRDEGTEAQRIKKEQQFKDECNPMYYTSLNKARVEKLKKLLQQKEP